MSHILIYPPFQPLTAIPVTNGVCQIEYLLKQAVLKRKGAAAKLAEPPKSENLDS